LDVRAGEVTKHGVRIRLQEQPFQILLMLLEHPGEVVLREEIRKRLWPNGTIVEYAPGINAAIQRLRDALGDSADHPRYVETVARRGYRFLGEVEAGGEPQPEPWTAVAFDATDLSGRLFSHYRILNKLGEGGMGVVYRAEDLKLGRQVALKLLPCGAGELPASILGRFELEARAASALNHPHICTIHGLENFGGQPAIVMELVEGQTLAERLAKGVLPPEQAMALAIEISSALAEAHRHGVVHHDLKPANIMLTKSGAKVLDFGLAKVERAAPGSPGAEAVTPERVIAGTPHYMSPEQVQGKETDARADIFSFGLVVYEMLSGRRAFEGDTPAGVMAAILEREPPPLAATAPPGLDRILRLCLAKDPGERWESASDLKKALDWMAEGAPDSHPRRASRAAWAAAALLAVLAALALIAPLREKPAEQRVVRLQIPPPGKDQFVRYDVPVVSPDGIRIVFSAGNKRALFVRSLDSLVSRELPGTEDGHLPFWSPDGRYVAFFAGGKLKKTDLLGGRPVTLADVGSPPGGTWSRENIIIYAPNPASALVRIPAGGGAPSPVTTLDSSKGEIYHAWPCFLPDGKHFLFTVYASEPDHAGVFLGSLDSRQATRLLSDETNAQYTEPGYLLFSRGRLMAQPFDASRLRFTGDAFTVTEEVSMDGYLSRAGFSASAGVLAYRAGPTEGPARLRWFDRNGNQLGDLGPAGEYGGPSLSPDGHAVAVTMKTVSRWDIWVFDLVRGTNSRLTVTPGNHGGPRWSPDGREIAFSFEGDAHSPIHKMAASGAGREEALAQLDRGAQLWQWTADGKYLIVTATGFGKPYEVWAAPLAGDRKPFPVVSGPSNNHQGRVSPDGKWIAYVGEETGKREVYVQDFPPNGGKWQISTGGGAQPRWRADGRELFYWNGSKVMAGEMRPAGSRLEPGVPKPLFEAPGSNPFFDVTSDGQKFLLQVPNEAAGPPQPFTIVLNWPAANRR